MPQYGFKRRTQPEMISQDPRERPPARVFASAGQDPRARVMVDEPPKKFRHSSPRMDRYRIAIEEYRGHPRGPADKAVVRDTADHLAEARRAGRPPDYREVFCDHAFKLLLLGVTRDELAFSLDVGSDTIDRWCEEHPEFSAAVTRAQRIANGEVMHSLYRRATGFEREAVKIFCHEGEPVYAPYVEYYPPDTAAATNFLKNREPELFRERPRRGLWDFDFEGMSPEQLDALIAAARTRGLLRDDEVPRPLLDVTPDTPRRRPRERDDDRVS